MPDSRPCSTFLIVYVALTPELEDRGVNLFTFNKGVGPGPVRVDLRGPGPRTTLDYRTRTNDRAVNSIGRLVTSDEVRGLLDQGEFWIG